LDWHIVARMGERNEVSVQEVRFYVAAKNAADRWATANELADKSKVAQRTARAFALKFVKLGLFDIAEVFPAHRYRLSSLAAKRNASYVRRLDEAVAVFGV